MRPVAYDGPEAAALLAAFGDEMDARYPGSEPSRARPDEFAGPVGVFLVAGDPPEACGGLREVAPGVGELKRMYVRPDHRGRGLSRLLLAALEDAARDLGYATLRLETGEPQPEAVGLYRSSGYHAIEPYGRYAGSPVNLCFEKVVR